ncbi:MAG: hypothetical protein HC767_01015 [Akkermansiaceae bacterium]|nr:hypothetical protein [Akkermansiaceae bacterium]
MYPESTARSKAVDVEARHVGAGIAGDDPVGEDAAQAAAGQDTDGVQPRCHPIVLEFRRLPHDGPQVGRETLRPAEELADARLQRHRHAVHGLFQVGSPCGPSPAESRRRKNRPECLLRSTARTPARTARPAGRPFPRGSSRRMPGPPARAGSAAGPQSSR